MIGSDKIKTLKYNLYMLIVFGIMIFSCLIVNLYIKCGAEFDYLLISTKLRSDVGLDGIVYVVLTRLKQLAIIILLMKCIDARYVYGGIVSLLSICYSLLAVVQIHCYGFRGIGVLLLSIFPHYIIYFFVINTLYKRYNESVMDMRKNGDKVKYAVFILVMFIIGIICEKFFSFFFLRAITIYSK